MQSHLFISLSLQPEFVPIFNVDNLKIPNNVLSVLRVSALPMVTRVLLLHELVSAANVGPSLPASPPLQANPPCLLSTVQYINNFYASRLSGEEGYWWMQFTAALEFIKTIDDRK